MEENNDILSNKYEKLTVMTEDSREILAEITFTEVKTASNIVVKLKPKD